MALAFHRLLSDSGARNIGFIYLLLLSLLLFIYSGSNYTRVPAIHSSAVATPISSTISKQNERLSSQTDEVATKGEEAEETGKYVGTEKMETSGGAGAAMESELARWRQVYGVANSTECTNFRPRRDSLAQFNQDSLRLAAARIDYFKEQPSIPKTVFNSSQKVVFFLGVEGTGHHFIKAAFKLVCDKFQTEGLCGGLILNRYFTNVFKTVSMEDSQTRAKIDKMMRRIQSPVIMLNPQES